MVDIITAAIPVFILLIVIEVVSLWLAPDDEVGYEVRDTVTSLSMGLGSVVVGLFYTSLQHVAYAVLPAHRAGRKALAPSGARRLHLA